MELPSIFCFFADASLWLYIGDMRRRPPGRRRAMSAGEPPPKLERSTNPELPVCILPPHGGGGGNRTVATGSLPLAAGLPASVWGGR